MLRAMDDNTLSNGRSIVFVRNNAVVRRVGSRRGHRDIILHTFSRSDIAAHRMADVWSIAVSKSGISLGRAIQELRR